MDVLYPFLQQHHLAVDVCVVTVVVAALHRNYVHRFFTIGAGCYALTLVTGAGAPTWLWLALAVVAHAQPAWLSPSHNIQPETVAMLVTGWDS